MLEKYRKEGKTIFIRKERRPASRLCQEIGGLIKSIRTEKGITQRTLATKLDISQQLISRIEKGYENISIKTLETIAARLGAKAQVRIHQ